MGFSTEGFIHTTIDKLSSIPLFSADDIFKASHDYYL